MDQRKQGWWRFLSPLHCAINFNIIETSSSQSVVYLKQRVYSYCLKCCFLIFMQFRRTCTPRVLPAVCDASHLFISPLSSNTLGLFEWCWCRCVKTLLEHNISSPFAPADASIRVKTSRLRPPGGVPLVPAGQAVSSPPSNSTPPKLNRVTVKTFPRNVSALRPSVFSVCANLFVHSPVWGWTSDKRSGCLELSIFLKQRAPMSLNVKDGQDDQYEHNYKINSGFIYLLAETPFSLLPPLCLSVVI